MSNLLDSLAKGVTPCEPGCQVIARLLSTLCGFLMLMGTHCRVPRGKEDYCLSQTALTKLRSQAAASTRDWAAKNGALAAEKDSLIRQHVSLKAGLSAFRASQALRLKQLSVSRCQHVSLSCLPK